MKIYFAHPVNTYGTPLEAAVIRVIQHTLQCEMENPNQPHHQQGYSEWKARTETSRDKHSAMDYFYEVVLPVLDGCAAMPFLDGRLGLGVAGEAKKFFKRGKNGWFVEPARALAAEEIEDFVHDPFNGSFRVRLFTPEEVALIDKEVPEKLSDAVVDPQLVLQHQETRLRTWVVYNQTRRPYETAHLVKMPIPEGFYPDKS